MAVYILEVGVHLSPRNYVAVFILQVCVHPSPRTYVTVFTLEVTRDLCGCKRWGASITKVLCGCIYIRGGVTSSPRTGAAVILLEMVVRLLPRTGVAIFMTFKCRRRANAAMPMFLTSCETEMHIWKYG